MRVDIEIYLGEELINLFEEFSDFDDFSDQTLISIIFLENSENQAFLIQRIRISAMFQ